MGRAVSWPGWRAEQMQPEETQGHQERILVVDDEGAVRGMLATLLERSGYVVTSVATAQLALEDLAQDPGCQLVLCDVMMAEVDGLTLLDVLCTDYPGVPVVMLTAVHDIHVATNAFRRGAIDYLLKPFELSQLLAVVSRALEHGQLLKQNAAYRQNLEQIISARTGRLRATMHDLEKSYDITLEAMGDALDLRDAETEGHSRRVTAYTIALAREMGLDAEKLRVIARGAFLHDIGKIATPDCILLKPGKLDSGETGDHARALHAGIRHDPQDTVSARGCRDYLLPPGELRRQGLPAWTERRANPAGRAHLRHRGHARCHDLGPAIPQGQKLRRGARGD